MSDRLSRIITRGGDGGNTGLADGSRRRKNDARIVALGELDELNAVLGLARATIEDAEAARLLLQLQHDLFDLGAELCQPGKELVSADYPKAVEARAQALNANLPPLKEFVLPGGSETLARLHLARTVCRRAERALVSLDNREGVNPNSLAYLNRLSDLLFILGRYLARNSGLKETCWQPALSRAPNSD